MSVQAHYVRLGFRNRECSQPISHLAEFACRVAIAWQLLPFLLARERGVVPGLGVWPGRWFVVAGRAHGAILAGGGGQSEAGYGEPPGQFLGRPTEINVLFEPVKGDFQFKAFVAKPNSSWTIHQGLA